MFDAIPPAEREQAVADRLAAVFKNPNHVVDRAYTKLIQRQAKKTVTDGIKQQASFENFITELATAAAENPIPTVVRQVSAYNATVPEPLLVTISDLHINARVEGLDIQDFNNEIVQDYMDTVAIEANHKNSDEVTVLINGDIVESLTGKNHPDSFVQMEYGQTYAQGIITARDIIIEFLAKINNLDKVLVIGGNHDRMTSSNKEDDQQGVSRILAEFLKFALPGVDIQWSAKVLTHETENINYIATHGDKRFASKDANALLWKYGVKDKYNVLLTGHWHHRAIKVDDEGFTAAGRGTAGVQSRCSVLQASGGAFECLQKEEDGEEEEEEEEEKVPGYQSQASIYAEKKQKQEEHARKEKDATPVPPPPKPQTVRPQTARKTTRSYMPMPEAREKTIADAKFHLQRQASSPHLASSSKTKTARE